MFAGKHHGFSAKGGPPSFPSLDVEGDVVIRGDLSQGSTGRILLRDGLITDLPVAFASDLDSGFYRNAANDWRTVAGGAYSMSFGFGTQAINGSLATGAQLIVGSYIEFLEIAEPAAPSANRVRIFALDDAAKTETAAKFPTGVRQQIAQEP